MAAEFDPYHKWLGIPPAEQPPNFYRLLALNPFESDPDVIEAAADARAAHLRSLQTGKYGDLTQPLLNQIAAARICLLKPDKKTSYDTALHAQIADRCAALAPPITTVSEASLTPAQVVAPAPTLGPPSSGLLEFISAADDPGGNGVETENWSGMTGAGGGKSRNKTGSAGSSKIAPAQLLMILGPIVGIVAVAAAILFHNSQEADDSNAPTNVGSTASASGARASSAGADSSSTTRPTNVPPKKSGSDGFSPGARIPGRPIVYLDDLRERDVKIGFGSLGKHGSTGYSGDDEMQRIELDGRSVAHALSTHPPANGAAQVSYALEGKYQSFSAFAMILGSSGDSPPMTPLQFRVLGDAKILWSSPKALRFPGEREMCNVSVRGVMLLTLEVLCPGPAAKCHAAWIGPIVSTFPPRTNHPNGDLAGELPNLSQQGDGPADLATQPDISSDSSKPKITENPKPLPTKPVDSRLPVPTAAEQQKAFAQLKELFKDDYAKAGSADGREALAKKLAKHAGEKTTENVERFVSATQSLDMAVRGGDAQLASKMVSGLSNFYAVDTWDLRAKTLTQLSHVYKTPELRTEVAQAALDLVGKAQADDRSDAALELATLASNVAAAANNNALRDQAHDARERIRREQKLSEEMKIARKTLADSPKDSAANLVVGRYLCLQQGDMSDGLPFLIKGSDPQLQAIAAQEQTLPSSTKDRLSLADAWWTGADGRPEKNLDPWYAPMRGRAAFWYRACQADLNGLELLKAQKRIAESDADHSAAKPAAH